MKRYLLFVVLISLQNTFLPAQVPDTSSGMMHDHQDSHIVINNKDLKFVDGPPGLPKGAQVTVLSGDPSKEGMFTIRAMLPANFKIPPHWHPTTENVTVIEGKLFMGSGEKFDESKAMTLEKNGYAVMPAKYAHYAFTKDKCTIQVHAMGPFGITYYNPDDDPRKKQ